MLHTYGAPGRHLDRSIHHALGLKHVVVANLGSRAGWGGAAVKAGRGRRVTRFPEYNPSLKKTLLRNCPLFKNG